MRQSRGDKDNRYYKERMIPVIMHLLQGIYQGGNGKQQDYQHFEKIDD